MKCRRLFSVVLALTVVAFDVPVSTHAEESIAPPLPESRYGTYRIGPADVLQISVWKNELLTRSVPVRPDGMISLPLVDEIRAEGLTPMELRGALKQKLSEYMPHPEISVIVLELHSFAVSVLGEVKSAGRYELRSSTTVLDLLAQAGGMTDFASPSRIVVLRAEGGAVKRIPFDYKKVIAAPDAYENFLVRPGDILVVP